MIISLSSRHRAQFRFPLLPAGRNGKRNCALLLYCSIAISQFQLLPPQSARGFSALARLYYLATKAAVLRTLKQANILISLFNNHNQLYILGFPTGKESRCNLSSTQASYHSVPFLPPHLVTPNQQPPPPSPRSCSPHVPAKTNSVTTAFRHSGLKLKTSWGRDIFLLPLQNDNSENHYCQTTPVSFASTYL